jgi:endonuclease/exonuclease/phosphatase family metal-dependent hydrolase
MAAWRSFNLMTLRLMTYNILDGGVGREAAISEVIQAAAPDVVVVQEMMRPVVLERIAATLNMEHRLARGPEQGRKVGLLSRLPVLMARSGRPWGAWRRWLEASIQLPNGQMITIYGVHLTPFHPWFFELWRGREVSGLLQHIRQVAPGPHLLAGDFNAVAPGDRASFKAAPLWVKAQLWFQMGRVLRRALKPLSDAGYVDCFRALHPHDEGFTLPASHPSVRLDYVFADPTLSAYLGACRVVTEPEAVRIASDHLPVLAEFVWAD